jgi:hypothetical protein
MKRFAYLRLGILLLVLMSMIMLSSGIAHADDGVVTVSYSPPFAPIGLSLNSNGQLSLNVSESIETPIGVFTVSAGQPLPLSPSSVPSDTLLLTIRYHQADGSLVDTQYEIPIGQTVGNADVQGHINEVEIEGNTIFIDASTGDITSIVIGGVSQDLGPSAQSTPTNQQGGQGQTDTSIPSFPTTAEQAAAVFGVDNAEAQLFRAALGTGWATRSTLTLHVYAGNCIDVPAMDASSLAGILQGRTSWVYQGSDHDRVLMASSGAVTGPATVYWGYCPQA